jgi:putative transport protein
MVTALFLFLQGNTFILLFGVVAGAAALGRLRIGSIGLGTTASAILIGAAISIAAATAGVELKLDEFTKLFAYYLFMYAVGLRIGPSFINSFDRDGLSFAVIAILASSAGLGMTIVVSRLLDLPAGMDVGLLAGALTESAAIGAAEGAVASGAASLPEGMTPDQLSANAAVGYSLTYLFSSIAIIILVRALPRLFGRDAAAAAREYEAAHGLQTQPAPSLHPVGQTDIRAVEVANEDMHRRPLATIHATFPTCKALVQLRDAAVLPITQQSTLHLADRLAVAGPPADLLALIEKLGREVVSEGELRRELDHVELIVLRQQVVGQTIGSIGAEYGHGVKLNALKRGGQVQPWGPDTRLRRGDVLDLTGDRAALDNLIELIGQPAKLDVATDLMTLGVGIVIGLLVGMLTVTIGGIAFGLGSAASVLVAGVVIASVRQRLPFFGNTPTAARQLLEDIGLTVFVAVIGVNAGSHILDGITPLLALQVVIGGLFVALLPPLLAWIVGLYLFKINPAVLMGVVAGARVNTAPVKEATNDLKSSVPWIGYPIPYAIANMLDSFWGYFLMVIR